LGRRGCPFHSPVLYDHLVALLWMQWNWSLLVWNIFFVENCLYWYLHHWCPCGCQFRNRCLSNLCSPVWVLCHCPIHMKKSLSRWKMHPLVVLISLWLYYFLDLLSLPILDLLPLSLKIFPKSLLYFTPLLFPCSTP
jgi:hypothetical protein